MNCLFKNIVFPSYKLNNISVARQLPLYWPIYNFYKFLPPKLYFKKLYEFYIILHLLPYLLSSIRCKSHVKQNALIYSMFNYVIYDAITVDGLPSFRWTYSVHSWSKDGTVVTCILIWQPRLDIKDLRKRIKWPLALRAKNYNTNLETAWEVRRLKYLNLESY